jgi:hypothetical protein
VSFLDIDVVLNCIGFFDRTKTRLNGYIGMDPELVARFDVLAKETGANVVLSSTWRLDPKWREAMKANGRTCGFLDRTPRLPRPDGTGWDYGERGKEIAAWVSKHPEVERYAIIDDDEDTSISIRSVSSRGTAPKVPFSKTSCTNPRWAIFCSKTLKVAVLDSSEVISRPKANRDCICPQQHTKAVLW